jgi:hypothetical protein
LAKVKLKGLIDIANLIGAYQTVCGLLSSFYLARDASHAAHPARLSGQ